MTHPHNSTAIEDGRQSSSNCDVPIVATRCGTCANCSSYVGRSGTGICSAASPCDESQTGKTIKSQEHKTCSVLFRTTSTKGRRHWHGKCHGKITGVVNCYPPPSVVPSVLERLWSASAMAQQQKKAFTEKDMYTLFSLLDADLDGTRLSRIACLI